MPLHQSPNDLNSFTKNIIKLYTPPGGEGQYSFVKQQCMHCLDPFCVAACPFHALAKNPVNGVVGWDAEKCIGCRYCEIACPFHIPKFEWDRFQPEDREVRALPARLAKGSGAGLHLRVPDACGDLRPAGETAYAEAKQRIAESPDKYFENRVYGEKEAGGTQVLYLSAVAFEELGLPDRAEQSRFPQG